ncbi:MAG TPA: M48 family metalloprotease [Blastocatellia bacterium]|nr:M48 family metalloprotease [Blastocatellia bacterium]
MLKRRVAVLLLAATLVSGCGGLGPSQPGPGGPTAGGKAAPHFNPGFNLFSPQQDVEMGRQSAQQMARQLPLIDDPQLVGYVRELGAKLAAKAPGEKFPYQFQVVGTKDINAFALPGGYIFVNAGTIAAAKNEGELAGVMAHEIIHVALRHGTNQASKAYLAKAGLGVLGAIAGGGDPNTAQVIGAIGGAGANMLFLKFGRTAETQSDLAGARILAEAGYDPRDMANFFKTLQAQGGQGVPEFLSDHPDPGNRIAEINKILPSLRVNPNPTKTSPGFEQAKARLTGGRDRLAGSSQIARVGPRDPNNIEPGARPELPAGPFVSFRSPDGSFALERPQNWDALQADGSNFILAPKGGYGKFQDSLHVTHGVFIGVIPPRGGDLRSATEAFVRQQIESNPDFRVVREPQPLESGGRQWIATVVAGPSTITGVMEVDKTYTTAAAGGRLFYVITIVPEDEQEKYLPAFNQILGSLQLAQ